MSIKANFYRKGEWCRSDWLWDALEIDERKGKDPLVISLVGAGGKTSVLRRLAWEGREKGHKILVMTTTHMQMPMKYGVLERSAEEVEEQLKTEHLAVVGNIFNEQRISFCGWENYEQFVKLADIVVIEADGSKCLPLKVPAEHEPVIPENTNLILPIYSIKSIGKIAKDVCFRLPIAEELLDISEDSRLRGGNWQVTTKRMEELLKKGYLDRLRRECREQKYQCREEDVIPVFHQADSEEESLLGQQILMEMGEKYGIVTGGFREEESFEWF